MVGYNTAHRDNPKLTARHEETPLPHQPLRVVVDSRGRLSPEARMLAEPGDTLVAVTESAPESARRALESAGAKVIVLPTADGKVDLRELLNVLGDREIGSVLVEGGGELLGSFFAQGLVDKLFAFLAPVIIGGRHAPTSVAGTGFAELSKALRLQDVEVERLGDDLLVSGYMRQ
jgi:diaminohydroxyphosphoribosylaminopyrimidine deaminase/5-amino-6-(5-phosphoribosylamino)uracil reductase